MNTEAEAALIDINHQLKATRIQNEILLLVCGLTFGIALSIFFI